VTQKQGGIGKGFGTMPSSGGRTKAGKAVSTGSSVKKIHGTSGTRAGAAVAGKTNKKGSSTRVTSSTRQPRNSHY
jgi:hypothetical protein